LDDTKKSGESAVHTTPKEMV